VEPPTAILGHFSTEVFSPMSPTSLLGTALLGTRLTTDGAGAHTGGLTGAALHTVTAHALGTAVLVAAAGTAITALTALASPRPGAVPSRPTPHQLPEEKP
jgi:hypothetical protein